MVSLRRRRLLGLCSGSSSFVTPLPLYCENLAGSENSTWHAKPKSEMPVLSDNANILDSVGKRLLLNAVVQEEPGSSNISVSSSSKEQLIPRQTLEPPIKRRKRHRRKNLQNHDPCMRGVYFKNMKWQAAIKVDKKQIHLGTVGSQEEAAHLYDRAAFMCGREPNFELPEKEKLELRKFKWEEFLAMTRQAITRKKNKRRLSPEPHDSLELQPLHNDWESKQEVNGFSACEDAE